MCGKQRRTAVPTTDSFNVKKSSWKSAQNLCRSDENGAQNLQVTHAEF